MGEDEFDFEKYIQQDELTRQLLGLDRKWTVLEGQRKEEVLKSKQRQAAYNNISADTLPRKKKADQKRGIITEVLQNKLIDVEILKTNPAVYLGSGVDVEYPLALGCRDIKMVDPILTDRAAKGEILRKVKALTGQEISVVGENSYQFDFDFGSGPERVNLVIEGAVYNPATEDLAQKYPNYELPEKVGVILAFASQGPGGTISLKESDREKVIDGGITLDDYNLVKYKGGKGEEVRQLGKNE